MTIKLDAFEIEQEVMFQHCDPAGIMFYPRYFEMINATVERWCAEALKWPFAKMHLEEGVGIPMASIKTEFHAPSTLGETLIWRLVVERVGGASMSLAISARNRSEMRVSCDATIVFVDMTTKRPRRWPDWLREKIAREEPAE